MRRPGRLSPLILALLFAPLLAWGESITGVVVGGENWGQATSVGLGEFDGRRRKRVLIKIIGE